jgi:integrase
MHRLSSRLGAYLKKHGVQLSTHGLRHAHASYLLSKGESIAAVSERLGHADPAITNAIYHQFIPSSGPRLATRWDEILEARPEKPRVVEMLANASTSKKQSA